MTPFDLQFQAFASDYNGPLRASQEEALKDLTDLDYDIGAMVSKGSRYGALYDDAQGIQISVVDNN